ncbi:hypothetical protein Tsubulata_037931 [Turnera subulata]|uniref:Cytochrome P450 n=1 Tax=Turnera subulata TaxID=218843 RepID=A0A9Q0JJD0_9ROSI|nr:hypothetical protein Tsubulata_037931 [Turnera subulata]
MSELFAGLTNDVVCRVALGRKYSAREEGRKFKQLLREFVELLGGIDAGDYFPWLAWLGRVNGSHAKAEKVAKDFDNFLEQVVEEHMVKQKQSSNNRKDGAQSEEDFVDVLLQISVDRTSIKALILDVFAAGTDTTAAVLEWAMTELLRHPEVMKMLQDEAREVGMNKPAITEDDLNRMHYLKAVIKETLRMHTPIPLLVPRQSTQDVKLRGFDIAAGTRVFINAWAIGRDPGLWDRADEFWPERFLMSSSPIDYKGHDFQLIPFGAGRRICPGIQFAMSTDELALANLVHKFDWSLPGGTRGEDLDMTESIGLTIHRESPLIVVATPYSA